jgi:hypothetical protein
LWTETKQKDLLIYQWLLQAYGLTRFIDTDSYKWENGLKRYEAAKMFVEFAKNVLCRGEVREYTEWTYSDIEWVDATLVPYIKEAYAMWILQGTKWKFRPLENISKKEFVAAMMRMFTNENMDVIWEWENRDRRYQELFAELWLNNQVKVWSTIERYDAARVFYRLYYNSGYEWTENGYVLHTDK